MEPARGRNQANVRLVSAVTYGRRCLGRAAFTPNRAVIVALALCLVAVIFVVRLLSDDPGTAVLSLYALPVGLVAAAAGIGPGLATAALCLATTFVWASLDEVEVGALGYVVRGMLFSAAAIAGAAVGHARGASARSLRAWLPEGQRSAGVARELLREFDGSLSEARLRDAQLLATELVSNVIEHGKGVRIELRAELAGERLRVDIIDHGRELRPRAREQHEVGGLGLQLVDTLSEQWGAWDGGSSAWFQLPRA